MSSIKTIAQSDILFVCHECDALQRVPAVEPGHDAICIRCKSRLFRNPKGGIDKDSLQLAVQLDQRVIQQIFKKARFVNEMMLNAFRNNVYEKPADRLDIYTIFEDALREEYQLQYKKNKGSHFSSSEELREFYEDGVEILKTFKRKKYKANRSSRRKKLNSKYRLKPTG